MARPGLARRALAEGIATFALVFAGCGAIVVDSERGNGLGTVGIAAVFGLVILAMVYATGHVSGAHINPAVTLAFTATRHFPIRDAAAYVPAQLLGAVTAALVLRLTWDGTPADLGATAPSVGTAAALVYEPAAERKRARRGATASRCRALLRFARNAAGMHEARTRGDIVF